LQSAKGLKKGVCKIVCKIRSLSICKQMKKVRPNPYPQEGKKKGSGLYIRTKNNCNISGEV